MHSMSKCTTIFNIVLSIDEDETHDEIFFWV
uniref:Uncharacterized protein n=1 Tax=Rhizophora mucronata TaxID=61149 RepID=A0A2P2Q1S7_RHIMU